MNTKKFSALKVAFAYIGTVVGGIRLRSGNTQFSVISVIGVWLDFLAAGLCYFGYLIIKLGQN